MTDLRTRPLNDDEWAGYKTHIAHAFLEDPDPRETVTMRELFPSDRFHAVDDGGRLIGGGGIQTRNMTLVGAGPTPVAAVSYVGVRPDARGRGALTALMRTQLDELHTAAAEPVAALWASQAPIYARFGYGLASRAAELTIVTPSPFRPDIARSGEVRWLDEPEAAPLLRELHSQVVGQRVGWVSRIEANWRWWVFDAGPGRSWTARRYALHHGGDGAVDGYAAFRTKSKWETTGPEHELSIKELVAVTPEASAGLWRGLLDLDMVATVRHGLVGLDDPLLSMLVNPRGVITSVRDGLWVRLVDVDRALAARRYRAACELVLEVSDPFCAWNAGRWRLKVDDAGAAAVEPTTAEPDLSCDVGDLGAAYLGGTRLTALAAAGRVRELRPGAVVTASRAFVGDSEPSCPEVF
ncbi:MAG: GNAT family N-acetyltransferase [Actinomycetota bacterium]|nr:GNAT family N-acetyltransferase [Actinomycetota bacterium]